MHLIKPYAHTQLFLAPTPICCLILDEYVVSLTDNSILVITCKIVAICEGRIASLDSGKDELIQQEATVFT